MTDSRRISSRRSDAQLLEQLLQWVNQGDAPSRRLTPLNVEPDDDEPDDDEPDVEALDDETDDTDDEDDADGETGESDDEFDYALATIPNSRDAVKANELILSKEELSLGQLIEGVKDERIGIIVDVDSSSVSPGDPHPVRVLRMSDDMEFELVPWDSLLMDSLVDERMRPLRVEIGGWLSTNRLERAEAALLNALADYETPRTTEISRQNREETEERQARADLRSKYQAARTASTETSDSRRSRFSSAQLEAQKAEEARRRQTLDDEIRRRQERVRELLAREKALTAAAESVQEDIDERTDAREARRQAVDRDAIDATKAARELNDGELPVKVEETLFQRGTATLPFPPEIQDELQGLLDDINQFNTDIRALSVERAELDKGIGELLPEIIRTQNAGSELKGDIDGFVDAAETDIDE